MRTMAIDYGSRRIGVAVSDALGITTRGVATVKRASDARAIAEMARLAGELEAEEVVVGLPLRADGTHGTAAERVMRFVDALRDAVGVPVVTVGEWLTSYEAEERMRDAGLKASERKQRVDQAAAVVILDEYLAAKERRADG